MRVSILSHHDYGTWEWHTDSYKSHSAAKSNGVVTPMAQVCYKSIMETIQCMVSSQPLTKLISNQFHTFLAPFLQCLVENEQHMLIIQGYDV